MLEDFLLVRAWRRVGDRWVLTQRAYRVGLSSDGSVIGYSTAHRERSWSQFKAGVPSRLTRTAPRRRRNQGQARELESAVLDEASLRAIDPASLDANSHALKNYRRACREGIGALTVASLFQETLAADLLTSEAVLAEVSEHPAWVVYGADIRWTIRADGMKLLGTAYYPSEEMRIPVSQRSFE